MSPLPEPVKAPPGLLAWLRQFLREELAPYPGRNVLVARMVIASTLAMLITMTFRLPFGVLAFYGIIVSRETHWATVKVVRRIVIAVALADALVLVGMTFALGSP